MGNSPLNGGLINFGNQACQVNVRGTSDALIFHGKKVEKSKNGKITEIWQLTYKVGNSTCGFRLSKTINPKRHHDEALNIIVTDDKFNSSCWSREFKVTPLRRDEVGLLHHTHLGWMQSCQVLNWTTSTTIANADIIERSFDIYKAEGTSRRGIMITEWKRKNKYSKPYMGSITHYFLSKSNGQVVVLYMAIKKIRVRNCQFDFVVDGPKQHSLHELAEMFDQLVASMKNTYNPPNKFFRQSSESESDEDDVDALPSTPGGHSRNAGGLVSNDGIYKGNYNGSTFIKNFIFGLKD